LTDARNELLFFWLPDGLVVHVVLHVQYDRSSNIEEVFMANPTLYVIKGPSQRGLELAFLARDSDAKALFTILVDDMPLGLSHVAVGMKILNFSFITCQGPNYRLGGQLLTVIPAGAKAKLPPHNFVFVDYNAKERNGTMVFSNA